MSNAVKNVMLRVISKRMEKKESLEEIFADFPRLSDVDKEELQKELGGDQEEQVNFAEE